MRAAPKPGRRIPAALAVLLFLLLTATSSAIAGEATPQAIPDPGGNSAGSVEFSLEGDFSGELTGFVARVRLLDASNTTLQSRFNPIDLPCAEPDEIVTLPVTGAGSGTPRPIAVGLVALAATIVLGIGGIAIARIRPGR